MADRQNPSHRNWPDLATLAALLALALPGCHTEARTRSTELLEARIRNHEETIASLRRTLSTAQAERDVALRESESLRSSLKNPGQPVLLAEHAETQLRISSIEINTLFSGGLDRDAEHGDELLTILVVPTDESGETLRASGILEIDAVDFAAPAGEQQIGHWKFDRDRTRKLWHAGLIGRGLQVTVPWQQAPVSESVTIHARLTLPDGREFHSTEPLRVLPPVATPTPPPAPGVTVHDTAGQAEASLTPPLLPRDARIVSQSGLRWKSTSH